MPSGVNIPASFVRAQHDPDLAAATHEPDNGTRAIEVHALFEETVIAVAHLADPRGRRVSRQTKALLAASIAALTIPLVGFIVAYVDMARLQHAREAWDRAGHPHNAFVTPFDGSLVDIAAALCLIAGVYLLTRGALRLAAERTSGDFTIGCDRDAVVHAPAEQLPIASFPLVRALDNDYALHFTWHMSGEVTLANGQARSLAQLVDSGAAPAATDIADAYAWPIPKDAHARIQLANTTFLVSSVPPPRVYDMSTAVDWQTQVYTLVTALSVMLFLVMVDCIPADPQSLSLDAFLRETRFAQFLLKPPSEQSAALPDWLAKTQPSTSGGKGKRQSGAVGQMGYKTSRKLTGIYGIKGPKNNPDPHVAKMIAADRANHAGVVGIFKSFEGSQVGALYRDTPLGADADTVLAGLRGTEIGDAYGDAGAGMVGSGKGGGGTGEATIGTGALGTIGKGGGGGDRSGYGPGSGGGLGRHRLATLPDVIPLSGDVRGSLDKEIIRRVIRRHLAEIKFCYEKELLHRSGLVGRVTVQFTIGGNGGVLSSVVQESTLHDANVEQCMRDAVRRWEFPQPKGGGIVIVSYPFALKLAGQE